MSDTNHPVDAIFDAFKANRTSISRATGLSPQTVSDWKRKGQKIPVWRRGDVLNAARREGVELPPHCIEYLAAVDRVAAA